MPAQVATEADAVAVEAGIGANLHTRGAHVADVDGVHAQADVGDIGAVVEQQLGDAVHQYGLVTAADVFLNQRHLAALAGFDHQARVVGSAGAGIGDILDVDRLVHAGIRGQADQDAVLQTRGVEGGELGGAVVQGGVQLLRHTLGGDVVQIREAADVDAVTGRQGAAFQIHDAVTDDQAVDAFDAAVVGITGGLGERRQFRIQLEVATGVLPVLGPAIGQRHAGDGLAADVAQALQRRGQLLAAFGREGGIKGCYGRLVRKCHGTSFSRRLPLR